MTGLLDLTTLTREVDIAFLSVVYELFGSTVLSAEDAVLARAASATGGSSRTGMALLSSVGADRAAMREARERLAICLREIRDDIQRGLTQAWLSADGQTLEARIEFLGKEVIPRLVMDAVRAWVRRATAEVWTLQQESKARDIVVATGLPDPYVRKIGAENCCEFCVALYGENGKYKTYRLSELRANGSNTGREARREVLDGKVVADQHKDWQPVIGSTHGWCNCELVAAGAPA